MKEIINTIIRTVKDKRNYFLLAIPFVLILLFLIFSITLFQGQNSRIQIPTPKITQTQEIRFPSPTIDQHVSNSPDNFEEVMKKQEQSDREFAEEQASIQRNYPWFDKLPLQTDSYFFYFDAEIKSFVGLLYPKTSKIIPVETQVSSMKIEIVNQLNSMGIPSSQYPISWEVTPEP